MRSEARTWGERALRELLGSEARARLLAWLCGPQGTPAHVREIARRAGVSYTAAHREMARLERLGMVQCERVGRSKRYQLVDGFALLPALRQVVRHTIGLVPRLRELLAGEPVDVAFVFGSTAAGTDESSSDIDLMVIGEISGQRVSDLCSEAEKDAGREVTPIVYRRSEFREQLRESSSFLSAVMREPKIFVKGDEQTLRQLGE